MNTMTNTIAVVTRVSLRVGQVTRDISWRTCCRNSAAFVLAISGQIHLTMPVDPRGRYGPAAFIFQHFTFQRGPEFGRSGGARPPTPGFWRPVLYQLSYPPKSQCRAPPASRRYRVLCRKDVA